jgi:tetratricopeptide (TPR) repeat protein
MPLARRLALVFGASIVLVCGAWSLWYGLSAAWSDATALSARWLVNEWRDGRGPAFTPQIWEQARKSLQSALQTSPDDAALLDDLGFLHADRAQALGKQRPGSAAYVYQLALLDEAIAHYRAATPLRPTFPYSWAYLALAKHTRGQPDAEMWTAFDRALQYGRNEGGVQPPIAQVAFAHWAELTDARKQAVVSMVATAQPKIQATLLELASQSEVRLPAVAQPAP